jgi:hypothetical protein
VTAEARMLNDARARVQMRWGAKALDLLGAEIAAALIQAEVLRVVAAMESLEGHTAGKLATLAIQEPRS